MPHFCEHLHCWRAGLTSPQRREEKLKRIPYRGQLSDTLSGSPSLHYSLPLVCPHRSRCNHRCCCWGRRGSRRRVTYHRLLPKDQGARFGSTATGSGPLEGWQVGGCHRAGAEDAQVHSAQHHRQVPAQQHGGEPAAEWPTEKTVTLQQEEEKDIWKRPLMTSGMWKYKRTREAHGGCRGAG